MRIAYATRIGDEDWQEILLTEVEERIADATAWALANGYDRIRVAEIDTTTAPVFGANLLAQEERNGTQG